jgi:hypothetical protein
MTARSVAPVILLFPWLNLQDASTILHAPQATCWQFNQAKMVNAMILQG